MIMQLMKPGENEYGDFYAGYISLVPDGNYIDILQNQLEEYRNLVTAIPEELCFYAYGINKWTIAQVLNHINDTERIFCYRALALSRDEKKPIAGYDHNAYVDSVELGNRTIHNLSEEFQAIRKGTIAFYKGLSDEYITRSGIVNGNPMSVRAMACITYGHLKHHFNVLNERYLAQ
jgi:hypothetical protein